MLRKEKSNAQEFSRVLNFYTVDEKQVSVVKSFPSNFSKFTR